jgi:NitT/TauT family transport system ATP-binding protein
MKIVEVKKLGFSFGDAPIIEEVSFDAENDEFVSLIGPSGCGKSTMLRIIAGLIEASRGSVLYNGREIRGPSEGLSFVFQDFALLPWLTNMENVELGSTKRNMSEGRKEKDAKQMLDSFGLSGSEDAYPNTLSGGMKQRVGIARALVSNPRVLLMDEPFSSIDELTAEVLRKDVLSLLKGKDTSVKSVIMVTHNVEEAVELSDKIVVLSDKPSKVSAIRRIKLERPRNRRDSDFQDAVDQIYSDLGRGTADIE